MSGQPERSYVLEQLAGDRAAILKDCAELKANRGKIDKYRETNLPRAQDAYLELQRAQRRILEALRDAQHGLLEMEGDARAFPVSTLCPGAMIPSVRC